MPHGAVSCYTTLLGHSELQAHDNGNAIFKFGLLFPKIEYML